MKHSFRILSLFVIFLFSTCLYAGDGSILAARTLGSREMQKMRGGDHESLIRAHIESNQLESLTYRGFTVLLNPVSNGSYEVQVYRVVAYGTRHVSSVFSSMYKSSVEYGYKYDSARHLILQHHFLFPPNSLTGWANPSDYAAMPKFDWGENYPARNCTQDTPIHSLEEVGREYLEAACMPDRETALRFAQKFVDYMLSNRGQ